ncbi:MULTISPECIES: GAP family protein [Nocardia]|uniref:Uncharacterized protein n=2 Tax=Nocardia TaxID=1817 RepID=A0A2T2Z6F0_9NOCA|nr:MULTISPECIES: GAP family protein [Nocardia]MBF6448021.1 GAP family protein [Nocardia elegans]PSR63330.1 hypothetical protein C8259_11600 [Nocardia nova]
MGAVIGDLLPLAVGVALSPIPIVAAILIVLSANAARAGTGFAIGWLLGIVVVTTIFVLLSGTMSDTEDEHPSTVTAWIKIVLGIVISAGVAIGTSGIGGGRQVIAVVVFTVIAAASVLAVMGAVVPGKGIGGLRPVSAGCAG